MNSCLAYELCIIHMYMYVRVCIEHLILYDHRFKIVHASYSIS